MPKKESARYRKSSWLHARMSESQYVLREPTNEKARDYRAFLKLDLLRQQAHALRLALKIHFLFHDELLCIHLSDEAQILED